MPQHYRFRSRIKTGFIQCIDLLGGLFCRSEASVFDLKKATRILVIRLDHLGDAIMARPAIQKLKEAYPHLAIDLMISAEHAVLFQKDPWIQEIIPVSHHWFTRGASADIWLPTLFRAASLIQKKHYDAAVDLRGDLRTIFMMKRAGIPVRLGYTGTGGKFLLTHSRHDDLSLHQTEHNVSLLEEWKVSGPLHPLPFPVSDTAVQKLSAQYKEFFGSHTVKIVLHSGAGLPEKKWPGERWRELIALLLNQKDVCVILIGTQSEKGDFEAPDHAHLLDLRGQTDMEELLAVISNAQYFIGSDSGPGHLAAAQQIPGLILFSDVNDPKIWRPWSDKLEIITGPIREITPDQVLQRIPAQLTGKVSHE